MDRLLIFALTAMSVWTCQIDQFCKACDFSDPERPKCEACLSSFINPASGNCSDETVSATPNCLLFNTPEGYKCLQFEDSFITVSTAFGSKFAIEECANSDKVQRFFSCIEELESSSKGTTIHKYAILKQTFVGINDDGRKGVLWFWVTIAVVVGVCAFFYRQRTQRNREFNDNSADEYVSVN